MMRCLYALLLVAASTFAAVGPPPLGYDDARHLLNRTGFAASDAQIREYATLTRPEAVDRLLAAGMTTALTPPPPFVDEPIVRPPRGEQLSVEERKAYQRAQFEKATALRVWWYREMLTTPSPLTERMTLFWHNHFVSSQQKVRAPQLIYRQNVTLRRDALGNFRTLLHDISKDPAMLIYLDNANSRRAQPNENFAREVMELFTLGEGRYTERDIKEAARAFTGWSVDPATGAFRYRPFFHDSGSKTVLGRSGNLDGDAVLDILLEQPACSEFIARKLWREFISPDPDEREIKLLAAQFRHSNYNIQSLLRAVFTSDAFYAREHRATLVKSPVDLMVGTLMQFDMHLDGLRPLVMGGALLGQNLFAPPNVKGWPGGDTWINSTTLLARKQLLARLFRGQEAMGASAVVAIESAMTDQSRDARYARALERGLRNGEFQAEAWLERLPGDDAQRRKLLPRLLLAASPHHAPDPTLDARAMVSALVLDPVYQLK